MSLTSKVPGGEVGQDITHPPCSELFSLSVSGVNNQILGADVYIKLKSVSVSLAGTCERSGLGHGAVLVLCGDDAGPRAEDWCGQEGQLLHNAAAAWVVFRQLVEALLQGISQEVELLAGLIKTSLGLE